MLFDVPVMAYDAGAVRETLGGAGVLLTDKSPELVAELLGRVLADGPLRSAILAAQRAAIARWKAIDYGALLMERLAPALPTLNTEAQRSQRTQR
jgi:glycosyltransferase involved in cell wall biosynthesis